MIWLISLSTCLLFELLVVTGTYPKRAFFKFKSGSLKDAAKNFCRSFHNFLVTQHLQEIVSMIPHPCCRNYKQVIPWPIMTHVKQLLVKKECIVYDLILERSGVGFYGGSSGEQIDLFTVSVYLIRLIFIISISDDLFPIKLWSRVCLSLLYKLSIVGFAGQG